MVVIRLSRVGKSNHPSYRVIVSDKRKDLWGDSLEVVGIYDPITKPKKIDFKKERVLYWLSVGAKPSATVHNLLVDAGVVSGKKHRSGPHTKLATAEKSDASVGTEIPAAAAA